MNRLQRTTRPNIYVIAAPAYAAALTRSKGIASDTLRGLIIDALTRNDGMLIVGLKFSKSPKSGKWYVYVELDDAGCLNIAPVAAYNRDMVRKYGTGAHS